ncbi:MAG TPA: amidohydrolase family protein [Rhizomicrobium sp.]
MIIDSHAHVVMPDDIFKFMAELVSSRANPPSRERYTITDEAALRSVTQGLVNSMDEVGTDVQFLSPRPYMMMHSIKPAKVGHMWTQAINDVIHRQCQMFPDRFRGVAGLPQYRDTSPENCRDELERCVKELGFVGCLINPDPCEGDIAPPPGLGDRFWYPLYEKMVELGVPALIHSASCCNPRESYTLKFLNEESTAIISLLESEVFTDFPDLKIVISHAGGAIPYHMGRFRAWNLRRKRPLDFDQMMRQLYFDTCNYSKDALDFQFRTIGTDNCLFGTERPGTGSVHNPVTGSTFDNLKPVIESIEWLSAEDRRKIFELNAKKVYQRAFPAR